MPLQPIDTEGRARRRVHVRRDENQRIDGVIITLTAYELQEILTPLEGLGTLDGAWFVLDAAAQALNAEGFNIRS